MLSKPETVTTTPADVRRVPCLFGGADTDVSKVFSQYRLVIRLRAKSAGTDNEKHADQMHLNTCLIFVVGPCLCCTNSLCPVNRLARWRFLCENS